MIEPTTHNITVPRWVPVLLTIDVEAFDYTGGTFAMQVRSYKDAPGAALISLVNATAGLQGISVVVTTTLGIPTSTFTVQIDEATIEALLPFAVTSGVPNRKPGSDLALVYDLHLTGTDLPKSRWLEGAFTITAGATQ